MCSTEGAIVPVLPECLSDFAVVYRGMLEVMLAGGPSLVAARAHLHGKIALLYVEHHASLDTTATAALLAEDDPHLVIRHVAASNTQSFLQGVLRDFEELSATYSNPEAWLWETFSEESSCQSS